MKSSRLSSDTPSTFNEFAMDSIGERTSLHSSAMSFCIGRNQFSAQGERSPNRDKKHL